MKHILLAAALSVAIGAAAVPALAADCDVTVGLVMELTGPAGAYGQAGAKAAEMAIDDLNTAGGFGDGCKIITDTRDSQSQGTVAVDQATQLVNIKKVPVIIGGIISSTTLPILTSVTAPAGVVQVSPASSSPTLTELGRQGKTNGVFFRTITSDALQGTAAAKYAMDEGLKKLAIIYVNNDFGVNMVKEFAAAYTKLGGTITSQTPYNEKQSSYSAEASKAMAGSPDGLYLVSYPVDGATIARAWISGGGPAKFLLNDGMNSSDFINAVGAQYLNDAYGTSSGTDETKSTDYFNANFKAYSGGIDPQAPAAYQSYDAGAIVALAIAKAGNGDPKAIKAAIPEITAADGTPIFAGKA
ncbi:MAG TPA: ABC transporter substrate-binding protein, partial [Thermomicrobiales bacterium]|nr:ABC transporter substrate-binding protein [Thermomicrobiales bacterium]